MSDFIEYPISQMDFVSIRKRNMVYVDKTGIMFQLVRTNASYFLSRPRRFGKSMLISTMKAYFEGRRELFEGLAISQLEKDWEHHPVIHIDLSRSKYAQLSNLHSMLNSMLLEYERQYGIKASLTDSYSSRLVNIIQSAHRQTGHQVVVLVDEYDAPMLDNITNADRLTAIRDILRDLYSPLKAMAQHLRFVFLTGVTKFTQLSIFSELNNLYNISMDSRYDALCGITQKELETQLREGVADLAKANTETTTQAIEHLKRQYDGYHFSKAMTDIYNPYSLINVLNSRQYKNYWFGSGTPTMLPELMKRYNVSLIDMNHIEATEDRFDSPTEQVDDILPVLYQSGYLTIKDFDPQFNLYTLGIPNEEVKVGLSNTIIRYYTGEAHNRRINFHDAYREFYRGGSVEDFLEATRQFYATIPYGLDNANERHYQALLYAALISFGADITAEQQTAAGRVDIVLKMPQAIYLIEFKYNQSAEKAARQIREKDYPGFFAPDPRPKIAIGLNINSDARSIDSWVIDTETYNNQIDSL